MCWTASRGRATLGCSRPARGLNDMIGVLRQVAWEEAVLELRIASCVWAAALRANPQPNATRATSDPMRVLESESLRRLCVVRRATCRTVSADSGSGVVMLPLKSSSVGRVWVLAQHTAGCPSFRLCIAGVVLRHTPLDSGRIAENSRGPAQDDETHMRVVATRDRDVPGVRVTYSSTCRSLLGAIRGSSLRERHRRHLVEMGRLLGALEPLRTGSLVRSCCELARRMVARDGTCSVACRHRRAAVEARSPLPGDADGTKTFSDTSTTRENKREHGGIAYKIATAGHPCDGHTSPRCTEDAACCEKTQERNRPYRRPPVSFFVSSVLIREGEGCGASSQKSGLHTTLLGQSHALRKTNMYPQKASNALVAKVSVCPAPGRRRLMFSIRFLHGLFSWLGDVGFAPQSGDMFREGADNSRHGLRSVESYIRPEPGRNRWRMASPALMILSESIAAQPRNAGGGPLVDDGSGPG